MSTPIKDGGPVFPAPWEPIPEGCFHPDNPVGQTPPRAAYGMSLRDYFAGQALAGLRCGDWLSFESGARWCYDYADAMIAAREKGGQ